MALNFQTLNFGDFNQRQNQANQMALQGASQIGAAYDDWSDLKRKMEEAKIAKARQDELDKQNKILFKNQVQSYQDDRREKLRNEMIRNKQLDSLWSNKQLLASQYTPEQIQKYGPSASIAYNTMMNAVTPEDFETGNSNLASAIAMYGQQQQQSQEIAKAAEAQKMEDEFALAMRDYNGNNWGLADIGKEIQGKDPSLMNFKEVKTLQQKLGVPATGNWNAISQNAFDNAVNEYNFRDSYENDLFNTYGAKKVIDSMNEARQQQLYQKLLEKNKQQAVVPFNYDMLK